jgi:lipopolysaccharide biosynthesis glycosyltransferase
LGLDDSTPVFNDGMAIVNVDYCKDHNLIDKIKDVINRYNGNPPVLSEGALNIVCKGHVKFVDLKYNLMAGLLFLCRRDLNYMTGVLNQYEKEDIKKACDNPICIHYLSIIYNRPWFKQCTHPYKSYYYYYKSLSPWKDVELKDRQTPFKDLIIKWGYTLLGVRCFELLRTYKHRL